MGGLEFLLQTSVLSYLGENHPQNASESWIAGLYLIIHKVEQSSGKALSTCSGFSSECWQQRVLVPGKLSQVQLSSILQH